MGFPAPPPLLRKNAVFEVFERLTLTFLGGFLDRTSWNIRWQLNQRDCELLHIYFKIIHQSLTKYPITLGLERSLTWNFQNQTLTEEGCYWWLADFLMPLSVCHRIIINSLQAQTSKKFKRALSENLAFFVETFSINAICEFELIF